MAKLKFNNKEMGLLEAKLYLYGLKTGIISPNLSDEERKSYNRFKELNMASSEREYLIGQLISTMKMHEWAEKKKYCQKHGHEEIKGSAYISARYNLSGSGYFTAHAWCSRCGMPYERDPTLAERKEWESMMKEEMTI